MKARNFTDATVENAHKHSTDGFNLFPSISFSEPELPRCLFDLTGKMNGYGCIVVAL